MRNFNPFCYSPFTILFLVPSLQYCHSVLNFKGILLQREYNVRQPKAL